VSGVRISFFLPRPGRKPRRAGKKGKGTNFPGEGAPLKCSHGKSKPLGKKGEPLSRESPCAGWTSRGKKRAASPLWSKKKQQHLLKLPSRRHGARLLAGLRKEGQLLFEPRTRTMVAVLSAAQKGMTKGSHLQVGGNLSPKTTKGGQLLRDARPPRREKKKKAAPNSARGFDWERLAASEVAKKGDGAFVRFGRPGERQRASPSSLLLHGHLCHARKIPPMLSRAQKGKSCRFPRNVCPAEKRSGSLRPKEKERRRPIR